MRIHTAFVLVFSLTCWFLSGQSALAQGPTRVAAIGDSNTFGLGIPTAQNTYPEHLQSLFGPAYKVENFGVSGADVLLINNGPYKKTGAHTNARNFDPDIVVSNLGINDFNLVSDNQTNFVADYLDLLDDYQEGGKDPSFLIQSRLPEVIAPNGHAGTIEGLQTIYDSILEEVRTNIEAVGIDVRSELDDTIPGSSIQGDGLHLTDEGALIVATATRDAVLAQQKLIITANTENVNNRALSDGQSFTINEGAHLDDAAISQSVKLSAFAMRNRTTNGRLFDGDVTLRIVEGEGTNGPVVGDSNHTINPNTEGMGGELVWSFDDLLLDKDTQYSAIFVDSEGGQLNFAAELATDGTYPGGRTLGAGTGATWDNEFTAVYSPVSIPDPSSSLFGGVLLVAIALLRRCVKV